MQFVSSLFLVYVLCKLWAITLSLFYVGCSYAGSDVVKRLCVFCYLSLCLEVRLLINVWFGTHLLLLQYFLGYEPISSWYLIFSSFPASYGALWRRWLYCQLTFLLVFIILSYFKDNIILHLIILFHCRIYIIDLYTLQPGFGGILKLIVNIVHIIIIVEF